jgi:YidC/Oxa1 family membrane protein insertase
MNKQNIIAIIAIVAILLPLQIYLGVKSQADLKKQADKVKRDLDKFDDPETQEWLRKHPEWWTDPAHPERQRWLTFPKVKALHDRLVAPVTSGDAVAAPASGAPAVVSSKTDTPEVALTPGRAAFLDVLAAQPKDADYTLTSKMFTVHLSPQGGAVDTLAFNKDAGDRFRSPSFKLENNGKDTPTSELGPFEPIHPYHGVRSFTVMAPKLEKNLESVAWVHSDLPGGGHRFERTLPDGDLVIRKDYLPPADAAPAGSPEERDDYHFILRVSVLNKGTTPKNFGYQLLGSAGMVEPTSSYPGPIEAVITTKDNQGSVNAEKKAGTAVLDEYKKNADTKGVARSLVVVRASGTQISYYGVGVKSFACVVLPRDERHPIDSAYAMPLTELADWKPTPEEAKQATVAGADTIVKEIAVAGTVQEFVVLPDGTPVTQEYHVFVGPRWAQMLNDHPEYADAGLGKLVDFSSMIPGASYLARLLTKVLLAFHWLTRSWGLSIIFLTLLVRSLLHPLMVRQIRSSQKMQVLGPETAKLKAKYEDKDKKMSPENQKKFQAEQWELMKKHGVNPLGCMGPMLLQLPIFIGLWSALNYAFELRQASFLWIRDLSEPDVVGRLPFDLPLKGTNALCILPFLMLIVYILQSKSTPKPTDPQAAEQQKMMSWMMPIFGYMFYTVPSGLLLYYITSATIGMLEQRWIKRSLGIVPQPNPANPVRI